MKISVSVAPAILDIQDEDFTTRTATEVKELVREHISTWFASEAQVDWETITENQSIEKAA
jgi:hypothetical protein